MDESLPDVASAAAAPSFMDQYGLYVYIGGGVLLLAIIVVVIMLMKKGKGDEDEGRSRQKKSSKGKSKGKGGRAQKVPARGLWFFAMVSFFTLGIFIAVLVLQYKEWEYYKMPQQIENQPRSVWPNGLRYKSIW
jgi:ABC-type Fe3+ transport system permease subunit